ncbi:class I SAM-dependent methyltransferase [Pyrobaculum aerophilum]|uniref:Methylase n=2 Tax=Pyrobaculum aerophilum TaxID=13773 RepID=Q8ZVL5_PYRAE|nr:MULTISPECIES: class I SAM-dependent methyltransferase [Pyrobaculum]AAL64041.1 conserved hypothetical protein [Pyrobaculum aerophilum str. IM2]MCX8137298.1 class I SAM-dependent methyltransferase [Pyrobaculum aerophilum]HII47193.1 class I SAM-dependent methyltransferase [Pyrobaculum aerophilum]
MPYKPSEDSYLTLEVVEELGGADICVDVGTGSCIIAEKLATKCRETVATDIDIEACKTCNWTIDVVCSDVGRAVRRADVAVFNMPYLPPEEPIDVSIHDAGVVSRFLRWISITRPRAVIATFSSLGRADFILEALRAQCVIVKVAKLHLFFETIYSVIAKC